MLTLQLVCSCIVKGLSEVYIPHALFVGQTKVKIVVLLINAQ